MAKNVELLLASGILFFAYCIYITVRNKKVLPSISDSWDKNRYKTTFMFAMILISTPLIIYFSTGLFFIAGAGIWFLAVAHKINEKITKQVHYIGFIVAVVGSFLSFIIDFNFWELPMITLIVSAPILLYAKNKIFWVEIVFFTSILIGGIIIL